MIEVSDNVADRAPGEDLSLIQEIESLTRGIERRMRDDEMSIDYVQEASKCRDEVLRELGHVNILIAGRTGVGKSTLINAVFEFDEAEVGSGEPVTMHIRKYQKPGIPLAIWDSRGLEMADYQKIVNELKDEVEKRKKDTDANNHIHVAWLCIHEDGRRVEPAEQTLHEALADSMPVIAVVTKARQDNGFGEEVQRLLPKAVSVVRVRAQPDDFGDGVILKKIGLEELVAATNDVIPEAHRRAFRAAQWADVSQKTDEARRIVEATKQDISKYVSIGGTNSLNAILVQMLEKISSVFGFSVSTADLQKTMDHQRSNV